MSRLIEGGYVLKARSIQKSQISHCSPCVREVWDWLLLSVEYQKTEYDGYILQRGQLFCKYKTIQEGLAWYVGFHKKEYSIDAISSAMKMLRSLDMIITAKAPRGVVITICNYNYYQNPNHYEDHTKTDDI